jgi:predicted HicB family RNase H-like nuclease
MSESPASVAPVLEPEDVLSAEFKIRCEPELKEKIRAAARKTRQKSAAWARSILWQAVRKTR